MHASWLNLAWFTQKPCKIAPTNTFDFFPNSILDREKSNNPPPLYMLIVYLLQA